MRFQVPSQEVWRRNASACRMRSPASSAIAAAQARTNCGTSSAMRASPWWPYGRTTSRIDLLVYGLLALLIAIGSWLTLAHNLLTSSPYDYRGTISVWWRSLFVLQPDVDAATDASTIYQVHAIAAWAFWALFPFSRLVHAWSIPLQYLGRPYILYRRRYATGGERAR